MSPVTATRRPLRGDGLLVATVVALGGALFLPSAGATTATATRLAGTNWILTDSPSLGKGLTVNGVSARFSAKRVGGSSGCNSYDAPYRVSGSKMTIGPDITSTKRACESGPAAVEDAYVGRLVKVTSYKIKGSKLSLFGKSGKLLLSYRVSTAHDIVGKWTVTGYYTGTAVQSAIIGTTPTADFGAKEVTGGGGCNSFGGPYTTTGQKISIGPLTSTQVACADAAIQTQEDRYFAALALATTYRVTGNRLELFRADGGIAVSFEAS